MTNLLALIIEDDPNLGAIFERTLKNAGFDTALDPDGDRYNALLSNRRPALVVLDLHLPSAPGEEILADLRSHYPAAELPVVIVTADIFQGKTLKARGETVMIKPISPTRLTELVTGLFPK